MNRKVWFRLLPSTLALWADQCLDAPPEDSLKVDNRFEVQLEAYPASNLSQSGNESKFEHIKDNKYNICGMVKDFHKDTFLVDCGFPIRLRLQLYAEEEPFEHDFYKRSIIEQNQYSEKYKTEVNESIIDAFISGDICLQGNFPLGTGTESLQTVNYRIQAV
jgi:hypothetical protein